MNAIFIWKEKFSDTTYVLGKGATSSKCVIKPIAILTNNEMNALGLSKVQDRLDTINDGQPLEITLHWDIVEETDDSL